MVVEVERECERGALEIVRHGLGWWLGLYKVFLGNDRFGDEVILMCF